MLADSTNAERPGFTATEQTVAEGVRRLFAKAGKRRIIVATFASNIYRVQQIIDLAIESGRKVAVSGRSMVSNTEMALDRSLADNLHDWASVKARVREALSSYIYRRTKRSPMILPILLEV